MVDKLMFGIDFAEYKLKEFVDIKVPEAVEYGMTICKYESDNPAAEAYGKCEQ